MSNHEALISMEPNTIDFQAVFINAMAWLLLNYFALTRQTMSASYVALRYSVFIGPTDKSMQLRRVDSCRSRQRASRNVMFAAGSQ